MSSCLLQVFVELGNLHGTSNYVLYWIHGRRLFWFRWRQPFKSLQGDNSIIILPADKGNATVVTDRVEYSNKLADLIGNSSYCKVKKDPTLKTERKLSQVLGKNKDLIPQTKYKQLIQHYSQLPHINGFPKIHKDGIPLRPIVSNRGSACHPLSRFLVEIVLSIRTYVALFPPFSTDTTYGIASYF